jgi:hypothetical protein
VDERGPPVGKHSHTHVHVQASVHLGPRPSRQEIARTRIAVTPELPLSLADGTRGHTVVQTSAKWTHPIEPHRTARPRPYESPIRAPRGSPGFNATAKHRQSRPTALGHRDSAEGTGRQSHPAPSATGPLNRRRRSTAPLDSTVRPVRSTAQADGNARQPAPTARADSIPTAARADSSADSTSRSPSWLLCRQHSLQPEATAQSTALPRHPGSTAQPTASPRRPGGQLRPTTTPREPADDPGRRFTLGAPTPGRAGPRPWAQAAWTSECRHLPRHPPPRVAPRAISKPLFPQVNPQMTPR